MASARQVRAAETRRNQRRAAETGMVHPRSLARSVAKAMGDVHGWRQTGKMPKKGQKYLHPEKRKGEEK